MIVLKHRAGFTLLELLLAMLIIGIVGGALIPQLVQMQPNYERKQFITKLNALVRYSWQQAITTRLVHRILFDFKKRTATAQVQKKPSETDQEKTPKKEKEDFAPVKGGYISSSFTWPDSIEIKQFKIEGFDEMQRFAGRKTDTLWFYIVPDGMTQVVTINFLDKEQLIDGKPQQMGLVLNPFFAQFKVYDAFQK